MTGFLPLCYDTLARVRLRAIRAAGTGIRVAFARGSLYTLFLFRRLRMSSVLKKRRKKMRKHKHKKLRRKQKFLRRRA